MPQIKDPAEITALAARNRELTETVERLTAESETAASELLSATNRASKAEADLGTASEALAAAGKEIETLKTQNAEFDGTIKGFEATTEELNSVRAELDGAKADLQEANILIESKQSEIEELLAGSVKAEEKAEVAEAQVGELQGQFDNINSALEQKGKPAEVTEVKTKPAAFSGDGSEGAPDVYAAYRTAVAKRDMSEARRLLRTNPEIHNYIRANSATGNTRVAAAVAAAPEVSQEEMDSYQAYLVKFRKAEELKRSRDRGAAAEGRTLGAACLAEYRKNKSIFERCRSAASAARA